MATLTVYPQMDGEIRGGAIAQTNTWSEVHDKANGDAVQSLTGTLLSPAIRSSSTTNRWQFIDRCFLSFDTSALGATSVVSAVDLEFVATSLTLNYSARLVVAAATPASPTTLVAGDYSRFPNRRLAQDVELADLVVDAATYTTISLHSGGVSWVSLTGSTTLLLTLHPDFDGNGPIWENNTLVSLAIASSEETLEGEARPRLVITYTTPTAVGGKGRTWEELAYDHRHRR